MPEWFLGKHLRLELSPEERALITVTFEFLINEALLQPQVFVHRDYHSRNLMVLPGGGPGVIDFQDALRGPIGYDLVSLLKDCYISWSRERVERWVRGYRRVLGNLDANVGDSEYQFMRWFDLIGVQRHIKVLGIFSRLWHRDGKIGYLADLPLVLELRARRLSPLPGARGVRALARVARGAASCRWRMPGRKKSPGPDARSSRKPKRQGQAKSGPRLKAASPSQSQAQGQAQIQAPDPNAANRAKAKSARVVRKVRKKVAQPQARASPAPDAAPASSK